METVVGTVNAADFQKQGGTNASGFFRPLTLFWYIMRFCSRSGQQVNVKILDRKQTTDARHPANSIPSPEEISAAAAPLLNLSVLRFRVHFKAGAPFFPAEAGAEVRGKLGHQLKQVFCPLHSENGSRDVCPGCAFLFRCPYIALFEPRGRDDGRRNAPVPFVFSVDGPDLETRRMTPGERGAVRFSLFGPGISEYREFSEAAVRALGRMSLHPLPPELVDGGAGSLSSLLDSDEENAAGDPESVVIRFVTPFQIRIQGKAIREEDLRFSHLVQALVRRMRDLRRTFGTAPDMGRVDAGFYRAAEAVEVMDRRIVWTRRARFSTRQDRRAVFLNGLTGAIRVRGPVRGFLPLLRAGEIVHVGKKTSAGNGRVLIS